MTASRALLAPGLTRNKKLQTPTSGRSGLLGPGGGCAASAAPSARGRPSPPSRPGVSWSEGTSRFGRTRETQSSRAVGRATWDLGSFYVFFWAIWVVNSEKQHGGSATNGPPIGSQVHSVTQKRCCRLEPSATSFNVSSIIESGAA